MKIRIRYFAAARERTGGVGEEERSIAEGALLADLLQEVVRAHPALEKLLPRCRVAVNQSFAPETKPLSEGDEVAIIPPVAGGDDLVGITEAPISPESLVARVSGPEMGAVVTFAGTVRDHARGKKVLRLQYEAYQEMAEKQLGDIVKEAMQRWPGCKASVLHRTGTLAIGEVSVAIAVAAPHRAEAFEACRFIIETLKRDLTIWKREVYEGGEEWVEG